MNRVIDGIVRIPLQRREDSRGWLLELRRESAAAEADEADERLLVALRGDPWPALPRARPGRSLRLSGGPMPGSSSSTGTTGETFTEDIGDDNPVAMYVPGHHAHGFEALTDALFCYHVTEEYDPDDPDENGVSWDDPRVVDLWSTRHTDPVGTRLRRVVVTGAGGQLGRALAESSRTTTCSRSAADWDVTQPPPRRSSGAAPASTSSCTRPRRPPSTRPRRSGGARAVNVRRNRERGLLGCAARLFLDRLCLRRPEGRAVRGVGSDESPRSVYGRTKLEGEGEVRDGWVVRSSWLFGVDREQFRADDARSRTRAGRGGGGRRSARLARRTSAISPRPRGEIVALPHGLYHVAAGGDCTWADFAEAIFDEGLMAFGAGFVASTAGCAARRPAPRPAYSVLRSRSAPETPRLSPLGAMGSTDGLPREARRFGTNL